MTRSPHPVERPILRLLLLALMGLALASRLALGATLPVAGSTGGANANDPLAKLQAATIMCHTGNGRDPSPAKPQPLLSDLLLFDLADNARALNAGTVAAATFSSTSATPAVPICPTTLASVVQALRLLGARAAAVQPVFITVDPRHDTPSVMRSYVAAFSPHLIGLTGTPAEVRAAESAYHVTVEVTMTGINHSAVLYLMAPDGHFLAPLPADGTAAVIATDLAHDLA